MNALRNRGCPRFGDVLAEVSADVAAEVLADCSAGFPDTSAGFSGGCSDDFFSGISVALLARDLARDLAARDFEVDVVISARSSHTSADVVVSREHREATAIREVRTLRAGTCFCDLSAMSFANEKTLVLQETGYGVTVKRDEPLRPKISGRYISSACVGATINVPAVVARAM